MIARGDAAQLTPFTTGRDNRSTLRLLPEDTAVGTVPCRDSSAKARMSQQFRRALVILRDGLTDYVFKVAA